VLCELGCPGFGGRLGGEACGRKRSRQQKQKKQGTAQAHLLHSGSVGSSVPHPRSWKQKRKSGVAFG
jgi:hypothetical protein